MWNEFKEIKSGKKQLREFGLTIGIILVILGGIAVWRGKCAGIPLLTLGTVLIVLGLGAPEVLKVPQKLWMALAVVIGFFMSRLVLAVLFYAVITPIGIIMKLFGKDVLDERINKGAASYWTERPAGEKSKESYENQY
jgi:hypothetical protein